MEAVPWGISAEEQRQARLQQLKTQGVQGGPVSKTQRSESSLAPRSSEANDVSLGTKESKASKDFLSALEKTLFHDDASAKINTSTSCQPSLPPQQEYWSLQTADVTSSTSHSSERDDAPHGQERSSTLPTQGFLTEAQEAEIISARMGVQNNKAKRKRERNARRMAESRSYREQTGQRSEGGYPNFDSFDARSIDGIAHGPSFQHSAIDTQSQTLWDHTSVAAHPPETCQNCNVNIAEIERTTTYTFPFTCPICHQPRSLISQHLYRPPPAVASKTEMPVNPPASRHRSLPPITNRLPSLSTERYCSTGSRHDFQHPRDVPGRWLHDRFEGFPGKGGAPQGQSVESLGKRSFTDVGDNENIPPSKFGRGVNGSIATHRASDKGVAPSETCKLDGPLSPTVVKMELCGDT
ncbi:hypothetical protein ACLMJK_002160 [Lecanora helva]